MRFESTLSLRRAPWVAAFALTAFAACVHAQTYNFRVLHRFSGSPNDGATPLAHVEFDAAGNLYGTTAYGGAGTAGTIFKIAKDGTESILYSFEPFADGYFPLASVTIDPATGDLYGTTPVGGVSGGCILEQGCGVLYKLATDGTYTKLYQPGPNGDALIVARSWTRKAICTERLNTARFTSSVREEGSVCCIPSMMAAPPVP